MTLTDRELKHLKTVIDYLYSDEIKHYEDEGQPENHIWLSVRGLQEIVWCRSPRTGVHSTPVPPANTSDLHLVTD